MVKSADQIQNHHYVPKHLLRNFRTGKKNQIHVFDKHEERSFRTSIRNIVAEKGFNDVSTEDGTVSTEPAFSRLESIASPIIQKIVTNGELADLDEEEFTWLACFVGIQFMRVRQFRERWKALNQTIADRLRETGYEPDEVVGFEKLSDEDIKNESIRFLFSHIADFGAQLGVKVWTLHRTQRHHPFFIGDSPVTLHNQRDHGPYGNIGLAVTGIEIYFPLSPTLLLGIWCPTNVSKIIEEQERAAKCRDDLLATKAINPNADFAAIDAGLELHSSVNAQLDKILSNIKSGLPLDCSQENVRFYNSLQVSYAHRYVMSCTDDFALVREMIGDNSDYKYGLGYKVD